MLWSVPIDSERRRVTLDEAHGHCQVNRLRNKLGLMLLACRALSLLLDRRLLSPGPERFGPSTPIADRTEAVTSWPEVTVDDGVR